MTSEEKKLYNSRGKKRLASEVTIKESKTQSHKRAKQYNNKIKKSKDKRAKDVKNKEKAKKNAQTEEEEVAIEEEDEDEDDEVHEKEYEEDEEEEEGNGRGEKQKKEKEKLQKNNHKEEQEIDTAAPKEGMDKKELQSEHNISAIFTAESTALRGMVWETKGMLWSKVFSFFQRFLFLCDFLFYNSIRKNGISILQVYHLMPRMITIP